MPAAGLGVQNRYVEWGGGFPDFDNDGRPDVFYVTGNVYPEIEKVLPQYPHRSPRIVFRNRDGRRFVDVSAASGSGATTPTRAVELLSLTTTTMVTSTFS